MGQQPWPVTFSFSRALEQPVLDAWGGKPENVDAAKASMLEVVKRNSAASLGQL
jgi:fructose-bisphosphate aldolase class I